MTTVDNTVTLEERVAELENQTKSLSLGLAHACMLIDQNMATTISLLEILNEAAGDPEPDHVEKIFEDHLKEADEMQKHFENLHAKVVDGTFESYVKSQTGGE